MAIHGQFSSESSVDTAQTADLEALQAILADQGDAVSYEEAADISYQLLEFFRAFGEDSPETEGDHA